MSLTLGTGPLAGRPGGDFNFDIAGASPAHRLYFEPFAPRLRAIVADRVVLDTVRARLLYETGLGPRVYAPLEDFDASLLSRSSTSTHCPFKGDASYWTLTVGSRVVDDAVWAYETPLPGASWLAGFGSLYWDRADAWLVEDERVYHALRDPYHRVDVAESSRRAVVRAGGVVVAATSHPKLLSETGLPPRVYVPSSDVRPDALTRSDAARTICPYKGEATYWDVSVDGSVVAPGGAWSYEAPLPEAIRVQGHVSFDGDGIEVSLDAPADRFTAGP
jgi:uncharacterized protein (DUF427 family)